ncbi:MAG: hypothetical protein V4710_19645 [Verrucomicrobiota bacterium]
MSASTGDAHKVEEKASFNVLHSFGFEDGLFRGESQSEGWRYAFVKGVNKQGNTNTKALCCMRSSARSSQTKNGRFVANICELECLYERSPAIANTPS